MYGYFITVDYLEAKILQTMPFMNADHYDHSSLNTLSCQCTRSLRLCMTSLIKQKIAAKNVWWNMKNADSGMDLWEKNLKGLW
jgi:hypothetical protein